MIESVLESNSKRFCKSEIRENFKMKHDPHMKKTLYNKRGIHIHQNNERKEKLHLISSFISEENLSTSSKT